MGKIKWTEEEIEYLRETYPDGESLGCVFLHDKYNLKSINLYCVKFSSKNIYLLLSYLFWHL